jgi:hypothetical protein
VRGGQVVALILAVLLLVPGGCFLLFGIGFLFNKSASVGGLGIAMLIIAALILARIGRLFRVALRRRPITTAGVPQGPEPKR